MKEEVTLIRSGRDLKSILKHFFWEMT